MNIAPLGFQIEPSNITVATDQEALTAWLLRAHLHLYFPSLFHHRRVLCIRKYFSYSSLRSLLKLKLNYIMMRILLFLSRSVNFFVFIVKYFVIISEKKSHRLKAFAYHNTRRYVSKNEIIVLGLFALFSIIN